ncbi:MAG: hypothetical protein NTZ34_10380 [Chloroflexi bacterium]|nr:hypothetical protein [Chloroflexota bacterium]
MNEEQRIKLVEEELKILKNEVKTILLDIREQYLNIQNPFNINMNTGTPPAGANPDSRDKPTDVPTNELDLAKDDLSAAPVDGMNADLSFGKPFTDLSAGIEAEKSGFQGPTMDLPGAGPSSGPGPSAETAPEEAVEDEEEQPQKSKSKKKGKNVPEVDPDSDESEGEDILANTKPVSPKNGKKKSPSILISGTRADLVVIAGLTQWVDQASGKLGKDRTEALVEMSTAMGRIPENIKDVLIRMVRISRYESTSVQSPTATDYLATLAQLESLMGGEQIQDNALLSILSMMKESNRG